MFKVAPWSTVRGGRAAIGVTWTGLPCATSDKVRSPTHSRPTAADACAACSVSACAGVSAVQDQASTRWTLN
eukprot:7819380-Prorocentrum_lima.AAC.1